MEKININDVITNIYTLKPKNIYNFNGATFNFDTGVTTLFNFDLTTPQTDIYSDIITIENLTINKNVKLFTNDQLKYIRFINCNISGFNDELASGSNVNAALE